MFLHLQFSVFDFRLLQSPDLLVPPVRSWPLVQVDEDFINNFGRVRESYQSVLSPYLLPEDNIYVDCQNSFKFSELHAATDPVRITPKLRRLVMDAKGAAKLLIGMVLHLPEDIPFQSLEEALSFALNKKLRIPFPGRKEKEVRMAQIQPTFKNLYTHATIKSENKDIQEFLVLNQSPLLMIDMSVREYEYFQPERSYETFSFSDGFKFFYRKNQLSGKSLDSFLTVNTEGNAKNRLKKYHISRLNAYAENLKSLLYFDKQEIAFSERAQKELSHVTQILGEKKFPEEWKELYDMYNKLFPQKLALLDATSEPLETDPLSSEIAEKIGAFIRKSQLDEAFVYAHAVEESLEAEEQPKLILLESRYHQILKQEAAGLETQENVRVEKNRISSALLKLFGGI